MYVCEHTRVHIHTDVNSMKLNTYMAKCSKLVNPNKGYIGIICIMLVTFLKVWNYFF